MTYRVRYVIILIEGEGNKKKGGKPMKKKTRKTLKVLFKVLIGIASLITAITELIKAI